MRASPRPRRPSGLTTARLGPRSRARYRPRAPGAVSRVFRLGTALVLPANGTYFNAYCPKWLCLCRSRLPSADGCEMFNQFPLATEKTATGLPYRVCRNLIIHLSMNEFIRLRFWDVCRFLFVFRVMYSLLTEVVLCDVMCWFLGRSGVRVIMFIDCHLHHRSSVAP